MKIFDWYKIFNLAEFNATDLVSSSRVLDLEDRGENEFLICKGNEVSLLFDGVLLPVNFLDTNPYSRGGYSIYEDENNDIYFGFELP